jgi:hypothetical protein
MVRALATLLVFQSLGEAARIAPGCRCGPGAIGMALLVAWLALRPRECWRCATSRSGCCGTCRCCSCRPASA